MQAFSELKVYVGKLILPHSPSAGASIKYSAGEQLFKTLKSASEAVDDSQKTAYLQRLESEVHNALVVGLIDDEFLRTATRLIEKSLIEIEGKENVSTD